MNKTNAVYIHIPFCKSICTYCDFCKIYYKKEWIDKYLTLLEDEVVKNYKNDLINTIYIGGGTPSSLSFKELDKLFAIISLFKLNKEYEFTFECNIEDINSELLNYLFSCGVNRLSIGIESFNCDTLAILGRHKVNVLDKINLAKKYFNNINIDLIYGVKGQTINDVKNDLLEFINLDITHISIYALILEENTILATKDYQEIDEDLVRDMYDLICQYLKDNNYIHYEISNFSKKGYESAHNLVYWNNLEYYGFGLGASGYLSGIRYTNTRSLNNYLAGKYILESHKLTIKEKMENEMILGLRKVNGVNKLSFKKKYKKDIKDVFNIDKLEENDECFYINENNLFISNYILKDFID